MKSLIALLAFAFPSLSFATSGLCPQESKTLFTCTPNSSGEGDDETLKKLFRDLAVCRSPDQVSVLLQRLDGSVEIEKIKTIMTIGQAVSYSNDSATLAIAYINGNEARPAKLKIALMKTSYYCTGQPD